MNIGELRESIRLNIDDTAGDLFTDAQLNNILKRAYNHLYRKMINAGVNINVASISLSFSSGSQEVIIASSSGVPVANSLVQKPLYCRDVDNLKVEILDMTACLDSGKRSVYLRRVFSDKQETHYLGYYLTPTTAFTVTFDYIPKITYEFDTMNDTTSIEFIPSEHHDVLINYATVLALGKDEINAKFWYEMYNETWRDMVHNASNVPEKYSGVVDVYEDEDWE